MDMSDCSYGVGLLLVSLSFAAGAAESSDEPDSPWQIRYRFEQAPNDKHVLTLLATPGQDESERMVRLRLRSAAALVAKDKCLGEEPEFIEDPSIDPLSAKTLRQRKLTVVFICAKR